MSCRKANVPSSEFYPQGTLEVTSCTARGWNVTALELLSPQPKGRGKAASGESIKSVNAFQIAGRLRLCWGVSSGCHTSTMNISRKDEASCQTSCSKESSKMSTLPSSHVLEEKDGHLSEQPLEFPRPEDEFLSMGRRPLLWPPLGYDCNT